MTVYNAHLNQVDIAKGVNRYYIVQALLVSGRPEVFCHWGKTGAEEVEEMGGSKLRENYQRYFYASKAEAVAGGTPPPLLASAALPCHASIRGLPPRDRGARARAHMRCANTSRHACALTLTTLAP